MTTISQKQIVIGKAGGTLKKIGQQARIELEEYFEKKVFLKIKPTYIRFIKIDTINYLVDQTSKKPFYEIKLLP